MGIISSSFLSLLIIAQSIDKLNISSFYVDVWFQPHALIDIVKNRVQLYAAKPIRMYVHINTALVQCTYIVCRITSILNFDLLYGQYTLADCVSAFS